MRFLRHIHHRPDGGRVHVIRDGRRTVGKHLDGSKSNILRSGEAVQCSRRGTGGRESVKPFDQSFCKLGDTSHTCRHCVEYREHLELTLANLARGRRNDYFARASPADGTLGVVDGANRFDRVESIQVSGDASEDVVFTAVADVDCIEVCQPPCPRKRRGAVPTEILWRSIVEEEGGEQPTCGAIRLPVGAYAVTGKLGELLVQFGPEVVRLGGSRCAPRHADSGLLMELPHERGHVKHVAAHEPHGGGGAGAEDIESLQILAHKAHDVAAGNRH